MFFMTPNQIALVFVSLLLRTFIFDKDKQDYFERAAFRKWLKDNILKVTEAFSV